MGCSPEDLPEVMDDKEGWQEGVKDIHDDDYYKRYMIKEWFFILIIFR